LRSFCCIDLQENSVDCELGRVWEQFPGELLNILFQDVGLQSEHRNRDQRINRYLHCVVVGTLLCLTTAAGHFSPACLCNLDL
jgi:hypothetical protein